MRQLRQLLLGIGLAVAVAPAALTTTDAFADARSEARTHYLSGVKHYNAGDYKSAIREFSAAQALAPADLNNYNLALCYDKLGDAEPAVQYYRAYLDKVPGTDKRAEIEASIQRLDAALKSAVAKKAEEARKAEEAKRLIEQKKAEEEAAAAAAAKKAAEEEAARKAAEDATKPEPPTVGPALPPPGVGSTGTPGSGQVRPTGDAQLDRVNSINIDEIRDSRVGGSASGIPDRRRPPSGVDPRGGDPRAADPSTSNGNATPGPATAAADPQSTQPTTNPAQPADQPKKQTPVYKKWWFWAVVGVSAYVLYSIASEDSRSSSQTRTLLPETGSGVAPTGGGATLLRF